MINRALIIIGIPLLLIGMPFALYVAMDPILNAYIYYPDSIVLTSAYSIVPFLSWFWILSCAGFICACFKIHPDWPKKWNKYLGTYIPCLLLVVGIGVGTIGKEAIKKHLINNGYLLITTEKRTTSFYIPYDRDIYRRIN